MPLRTGGTVRALVLIALGAALAGCSGGSSSAPASRADARSSPLKACPVTRPDGSAPFKRKGFNYGNRWLGVVLWPKGVLVAGPLPDGGSYAVINPEGSIYAKQGWWREVEGRLRVRGERLDGAAPPLRVDVPEGYAATGFQPTGLTFQTAGCWRIVGRVGDAELAFVVRVVKP
jgi:hypothetical protein